MLGTGRSRVCSRARGETLEVAVGTGLVRPEHKILMLARSEASRAVTWIERAVTATCDDASNPTRFTPSQRRGERLRGHEGERHD
jgi:hypothetical protein